MKAVLQRVSRGEVRIDNNIAGKVGKGFVILLGVGQDDTQEDIDWLVRKITQMRVFADGDGKMNLDIQQVRGECLVISQFTLHASTKKGNRPSFIHAAPPDVAEKLYKQFVKSMEIVLPSKIQTGEFGAFMEIQLVNDGPVTILLDTRNKE